MDETRLTQVGRATEELGVHMIPAYSPQARGRPELSAADRRGAAADSAKPGARHLCPHAHPTAPARDLNVLHVEVMQLLGEAFKILNSHDVKRLFGAALRLLRRALVANAAADDARPVKQIHEQIGVNHEK